MKLQYPAERLGNQEFRWFPSLIGQSRSHDTRNERRRYAAQINRLESDQTQRATTMLQCARGSF
jgi:hypothetical protein